MSKGSYLEYMQKMREIQKEQGIKFNKEDMNLACRLISKIYLSNPKIQEPEIIPISPSPINGASIQLDWKENDDMCLSLGLFDGDTICGIRYINKNQLYDDLNSIEECVSYVCDFYNSMYLYESQILKIIKTKTNTLHYLNSIHHDKEISQIRFKNDVKYYTALLNFKCSKNKSEQIIKNNIISMGEDKYIFIGFNESNLKFLESIKERKRIKLYIFLNSIDEISSIETIFSRYYKLIEHSSGYNGLKVNIYVSQDLKEDLRHQLLPWENLYRLDGASWLLLNTNYNNLYIRRTFSEKAIVFKKYKKKEGGYEWKPYQF